MTVWINNLSSKAPPVKRACWGESVKLCLGKSPCLIKPWDAIKPDKKRTVMEYLEKYTAFENHIKILVCNWWTAHRKKEELVHASTRGPTSPTTNPNEKDKREKEILQGEKFLKIEKDHRHPSNEKAIEKPITNDPWSSTKQKKKTTPDNRRSTLCVSLSLPARVWDRERRTQSELVAAPLSALRSTDTPTILHIAPKKLKSQHT